MPFPGLHERRYLCWWFQWLQFVKVLWSHQQLCNLSSETQLFGWKGSAGSGLKCSGPQKKELLGAHASYYSASLPGRWKKPEEPYVIPRVLFAFHILNSSIVIFYNVLILIPVVYSNHLNDVYRDCLIAHGEFYKNKTAIHSRLPYQELNEYFDAWWMNCWGRKSGFEVAKEAARGRWGWYFRYEETTSTLKKNRRRQLKLFLQCSNVDR